MNELLSVVVLPPSMDAPPHAAREHVMVRERSNAAAFLNFINFTSTFVNPFLITIAHLEFLLLQFILAV